MSSTPFATAGTAPRGEGLHSKPDLRHPAWEVSAQRPRSIEDSKLADAKPRFSIAERGAPPSAAPLHNSQKTVETTVGAVIKSGPPFDAGLVRAYVEMIHGRAEGIDGEIVLTVFGEDPSRLDMKTGERGCKIHSQVWRYCPGDVERNVMDIMAWESIEHANVYIPLHVVRKGLGRNARGKKEDVVAVLGLIADLDSDTGKTGVLPLEPSFIMETSPGNFQAAFLFETPALPAQADLCAKALQRATSGDFGTGDISHVWRVPGTLNWPNAAKLARGRSPAPALVRLKKSWDGTLVSPDILKATLAPWTKIDGAPATAQRGSHTIEAAEGTLLEPSSDVSAILAKLPPRTGYEIKATPPAGEDRSPHCWRAINSMIECGLSDDEIHLATSAYPEGLFARYHREGKDLTADIRRARSKRAGGLSPQAPAHDDDLRNRPTISLVAGQIERVVDEAESALISAKCGLYQRAGLFVYPGNASMITAEGRTVRRIGVFECGEHALLERLASAARYQKYDARAKALVACDPPKEVARTLMQRRGRLKLPTLRGVVNAPTLRADGSPLDRPGYDQATGLLFDPLGVEFPKIPLQPTRADAEAALSLLLDLTSGFPFVANTDRSVALSAILTACIRPALPTAPLHAFASPVAGSGKSKLVDIASVIATGREAGVIAQGRTEEELEKRIGALLLNGVGVIAIDNCESPLGGEFLCQILTQETVRTRILGKSEAPELPSNAFIAATGNNLTLQGDLTRRAILCRLDPQHERPELRRFEFDPVALAKAKRAELVVAALTIIRAYYVAGHQIDDLSPFGSFEAWSRWVRGALVWLGVGNPVESLESIRAGDPILEMLRAVLEQWRSVVGDHKLTTQEVVFRAHDDRRLRDVLIAVAGQPASEINQKRLGKWLASNKGRIVDGYRIAEAGIRQGYKLWAVVRG